MPVEYARIRALATVCGILRQGLSDVGVVEDVTENGDGSLTLTTNHQGFREKICINVTALPEPLAK